MLSARCLQVVVIVEVGVVVLGVEADVTLVVVAVGEEVRESSFF